MCVGVRIAWVSVGFVVDYVVGLYLLIALDSFRIGCCLHLRFLVMGCLLLLWCGFVWLVVLVFECCNFVGWVWCVVVCDGGFVVVLLACLCLGWCVCLLILVFLVVAVVSWFSRFWFRELSVVWLSCWVWVLVLVWDFALWFVGIVDLLIAWGVCCGWVWLCAGCFWAVSWVLLL